MSYKSKGIRFLVQTKGVGRSFKLDAIILQSSLGAALTKMSIIVVDFLMLYVVKSNFNITLIILRSSLIPQGKVLFH